MQATTLQDQDKDTLKAIAEELTSLSEQEILALIQFTASECDNRLRIKALHLSLNKDLLRLRKAQMLMRQLSRRGKLALIRLCTKFLTDAAP